MAADRFLDLASLLTLLYLSTVVLGIRKYLPSYTTILFSILFGGAFVASLLFLPKHSKFKYLDRSFKFFDGVRSGMKPLLRPRTLVLSGLYTYYGWIAHALIVLLLVYGVENSLSIYKCLLVVGAVAFASAIPSSPGSFGPFELAVMACLVGLFKMDREKAATVAVLYHLVQLLPTLTFGAIGYFLLGYRALIKRSKVLLKT